MWLDPRGDVRYTDLFTIDFRVDKTFNLGMMRVIPAMDVFNLSNVNTVMSRRRLQNDPLSANYVRAIVAPRIIRFGVRVTW